MLEQKAERMGIPAAMAIVACLNAYVATGQSLDRLAYTCGIEEFQLHKIAAGEIEQTHSGTSHVHSGLRESIQRIADYLDTLATFDDNAGYAVTPTFNRIHTLIAHAHQNNIILAITGAWGIGKTQAARYYAANHPRRHNQPGAVYVALNETENSARTLIGKILHHIGISGGKQSQRSMMQTLLGALRPGDHLILDECHKVKEALEILSAIHDEAGIGITTIGNPVYSSTVWGDSNAFAALASRAHRFDFPANTEQDVDAWLAWHGLPDNLDTRERTAYVRAAVKIGTNGQSSGGIRALAQCVHMNETLYKGNRLTSESLQGMVAQVKSTPRSRKASQ